MNELQKCEAGPDRIRCMAQLPGSPLLRIPAFIRRLLLSWLLAVTLEYHFLEEELRSLAGMDGLAQMSLMNVFLMTGAGMLLLSVLARAIRTDAAERWGMLFIFSWYSVTALRASFSWAFLTVCVLIGLGLFVYSVYGWNCRMKLNGESEAGAVPKSRLPLWLTIGLSAAFFLFVCAWTVGRVYSFSCPSYDFGIFSQMFYSMRKCGLPMTTIERDGLLSHLAVHVSPIYYLLLPFYCLVPEPAALQVLQAAVITSSVIPLWKIGKQHGLSDIQRMMVCGVLLLYPAFSGGTGYDIHENCFLTPLILWLFYGIDTKNKVLTMVSALLVLMVKEDAAVYTAVLALWLIIRSSLGFPGKGRNRINSKADSEKKAYYKFTEGNLYNLITGILLLAVSLVWFFFVTSCLAAHGDGVMTCRYDNLIYDGSSSLIAVVKAVLMNPMKAVYECVDAEKLPFIAMTLLPLLGLPLLTRRYERYILLIPYVLVNLLSDYQYQHNIFFQYTFGSTACLLYLTVVNLADFKLNWHRLLILAAAAAVSMGYFGSTVVPRAAAYPMRAIEQFEQYQELRELLSEIPEEASVTATTFHTTCLSQREVLYDVGYASKEHLLSTEYVVLAPDYANAYKKYAAEGKDGYEVLTEMLEENGYRLEKEIEGKAVVYHK